MHETRGGPFVCRKKPLCICTWNVEGSSDEKLHELERIMDRLGIHILSVEETYIVGADSYFSDVGSLIIVFGGALGEREYAGVGFIIAAPTRAFVIEYKEHTYRLASLRIRISGGQLGIVSVYAPINIAKYAI